MNSFGFHNGIIKEYRLTASSFQITPRHLEGYDLRVTHGLGRPFQVYDITIIFS